MLTYMHVYIRDEDPHRKVNCVLFCFSKFWVTLLNIILSKPIHFPGNFIIALKLDDIPFLYMYHIFISIQMLMDTEVDSTSLLS